MTVFSNPWVPAVAFAVTKATCCWTSTPWMKPLTTVNSASFATFTFTASPRSKR